MKRRAVLNALVVGFLLLGCGTAPAFSTTQTISLKIEGMVWGTWPVLVKTALERLEGVKQAKVTFKPPEAVVQYDPERVTLEEMIAAIEQAGFRGKANP